MKMSTANYNDFKTVVDSFDGLRTVFYAATGSNTVAGALAVFFSRDQYVKTGAGAIPVSTLLTDFPNAILTVSPVSGSY